MIKIKNPNFLRDSLHNCSKDCTNHETFDGISGLKSTQIYGRGIVLGITTTFMSMGLNFEEAFGLAMQHKPNDMDTNCIPDGWYMKLPELNIAAEAIKKLRETVNELEKNPSCLDDVMADIDEWWGHQTGRLG